MRETRNYHAAIMSLGQQKVADFFLLYSTFCLAPRPALPHVETPYTVCVWSLISLAIVHVPILAASLHLVAVRVTLRRLREGSRCRTRRIQGRVWIFLLHGFSHLPTFATQR